MDYLKDNRKWIGFHAVTWCIAKILFLSIKLWGIKNIEFQETDIHIGLLFSSVAFTGLIDGIVFGLIDHEFDKVFRQLSFLRRVFAKTAINISVGITLTILLVPMVMGWKPLNGISFFSETLVTPNLIMMAVYIFLITVLLQLLKMAASWIHAHDLFQIFSHQNAGVEEDRIFMFLDMKSSTTHAEKLGAGRYSLLIQDCFYDMTRAAKMTDAEVYQYVGDEAVFTWKTSDLNIQRSAQHYFYFQENLRQRSTHYRNRYGVVPEFKAGIHHGKVIRTQVGVTRKSIAFHGDAINTAARIQGKCNELGRNLLVSAAIKDRLPVNYCANPEGQYQLRGKDHKVNLFSISVPIKNKKFSAIQKEKIQQRVECRKANVPVFKMWLNFL